MSLRTDYEYLDCQAVADFLGVERKSVYQYVYRGWMPPPDLVMFTRFKLWRLETIIAWRDEKWKPYRKRKPIARPEIAKPSGRSTGRLRHPNVARRGAAVPAQPKAARKRTRAGASAQPAMSVVAEDEARRIAAELRSSGWTCTTADVMVLAGHDGEGLDHERELLRQRILQRLDRR